MRGQKVLTQLLVLGILWPAVRRPLECHLGDVCEARILEVLFVILDGVQGSSDGSGGVDEILSPFLQCAVVGQRAVV